MGQMSTGGKYENIFKKQKIIITKIFLNTAQVYSFCIYFVFAKYSISRFY